MSSKNRGREKSPGTPRGTRTQPGGGTRPSRRAWMGLVFLVAVAVFASTLLQDGGRLGGLGDLAQTGPGGGSGEQDGAGDGISPPPGDQDPNSTTPPVDGEGDPEDPPSSGQKPPPSEDPPPDPSPAGTDPWSSGWLTADFPGSGDGDLLLVSFFDVGQGDASLLQTRGCTILIDAGRHDRSDVPGHLRAAGVETIDYLILTHPHADHIGQVPAVMQNHAVGEVWASGWEHPTRTFERTLDAILASDAGYREPRAGEEQDCGPLTIEVLNPLDPLEDIHDDVAVRIAFDEVALIWTGDAEDYHEAGMISRGHNLKAQVLQLGHHGSSTSSSRPFVEAVDPEVVIYSAEKGNSYGHPHRETVGLMKELAIPMYGTDDYATIWVVSDGRSFHVKTEKDFYGSRP